MSDTDISNMPDTDDISDMPDADIDKMSDTENLDENPDDKNEDDDKIEDDDPNFAEEIVDSGVIRKTVKRSYIIEEVSILNFLHLLLNAIKF